MLSSYIIVDESTVNLRDGLVLFNVPLQLLRRTKLLPAAVLLAIKLYLTIWLQSIVIETMVESELDKISQVDGPSLRVERDQPKEGFHV